MGKALKLRHQVQWHFQAKKPEKRHFAVVYLFTLYNIQFKISTSYPWLLHRFTCSRIPYKWSNCIGLFHIDFNKTATKNWILILVQLRFEPSLLYHNKLDWGVRISCNCSPWGHCSNKFGLIKVHVWNDLWYLTYHSYRILSNCHQRANFRNHFDQYLGLWGYGKADWSIKVFLLFYELGWSYHRTFYWGQRFAEALKGQKNDRHGERLLLWWIRSLCKNHKIRIWKMKPIIFICFKADFYIYLMSKNHINLINFLLLHIIKIAFHETLSNKINLNTTLWASWCKLLTKDFSWRVLKKVWFSSQDLGVLEKSFQSTAWTWKSEIYKTVKYSINFKAINHTFKNEYQQICSCSLNNHSWPSINLSFQKYCKKSYWKYQQSWNKSENNQTEIRKSNQNYQWKSWNRKQSHRWHDDWDLKINSSKNQITS